MDHPLLDDSEKQIRSRVVNFFKNGFTIQRQSNLVFVCGGNEPEDMRTKLESKFVEILPEYQFFKPEFAMNDYFGMGSCTPFDITEFESLIGSLSHSVVIFPEGPGSYAELSYFCTVDEIAQKTLTVLDSNRQTRDSFLSLGPIPIYDRKSIFRSVIQMDYENPNFGMVANRIKDRAPLVKYWKNLKLEKFSDCTVYELFGVVEKIVSTLRIATVDDILFMLNAMFSAQISDHKVKQVISILIGSKRVSHIGKYGHLTSGGGPEILDIRDGSKTKFVTLKTDLATIFLSAEPEFQSILEGL